MKHTQISARIRSSHTTHIRTHIRSARIFAQFMIFALIISLSTLSAYAAQTPVDLGTAGNFVILAKSGVSTTGTTKVVGDIGVSPVAASYITGFSLIADASNQFSKSSLVTGKIYAADYSPPTPTTMTTAISNMQTAYTDAAGRTLPDKTELGAGNIGGMTLAPGLYKWGTGVTIPTDVVLSGSATDVWIFQIAQTLDISSGKKIVLAGGAQAKNVFWQVGGQTTIGTTAAFNGNILSKTAIVMNTGATLNGRALAQTAVTLNANSVLLPTSSTSVTSPPSGSGSGGSGSSGGSNSGTYNWKCGTWSACNSTGIRTQLCTQIGSTSTTTEKQSCKYNQTTPERKENLTVKNSTAEKNETTQGIGQELNKQIMERREEIKSGEYTSPLGQLLNVKELSNNLKELRVNNIPAKTDLNITADTDAKGKTTLKTKLKNGREIEIKIMPDNASKRALDRLAIKVCSSDNNCTIQLKNVGTGNNETSQYELQVDRNSKVFGLFQKRMHVSANVDAQTGNTVIHKPWWAFLATEPAE